eukprot:PhM_4_TR7926/c3_g1_i2/m.41279
MLRRKEGRNVDDVELEHLQNNNNNDNNDNWSVNVVTTKTITTTTAYRFVDPSGNTATATTASTNNNNNSINSPVSTPDAAALLALHNHTNQAMHASIPGTHKPLLSTVQLAGVAFLIAIGGGYGLEGCVQYAGPLLTIAFTVILPWVWCLPTTLCVAELACSIPSNGGPIMWVNVAFPNWFTLMVVQWSLMLQFVDNALYPTLGADYVATVFHLSSFGRSAIKATIVTFCTVCNILGVQIVGTGSIILMAFILLPFVCMVCVFFVAGDGVNTGHIRWENVMHVPAVVQWASFLPLISWNLAGLDNAGNLAEEVRNPQKAFVRSLLIVIFITVLAYIPPVLVGVSAWAHPNWSHWEDGHWIRVGEQIGGDDLRVVVLVGAVASSVGFLLTNLCTSSRSLAGMAAMGVFPSNTLAHYSPRYRTPVNAILLNAVVLFALSLYLEFEQLVSIFQVLYSLRVLAMYGATLSLRQRYPTLPRPFRIPISERALTILLGIAGCVNVLMCLVTLIGGGNSIESDHHHQHPNHRKLGPTQTVFFTLATVSMSFVVSVLYVGWWRKGVVLRGYIEPVVTTTSSTSDDDKQ